MKLEQTASHHKASNKKKDAKTDKSFNEFEHIHSPQMDYTEIPMKYRTQYHWGYSLVEVFIVICVTSIILTANISLFIRAIKLHAKLQAKTERIFTHRAVD